MQPCFAVLVTATHTQDMRWAKAESRMRRLRGDARRPSSTGGACRPALRSRGSPHRLHRPRASALPRAAASPSPSQPTSAAKSSSSRPCILDLRARPTARRAHHRAPAAPPPDGGCIQASAPPSAAMADQVILPPRPIEDVPPPGLALVEELDKLLLVQVCRRLLSCRPKAAGRGNVHATAVCHRSCATGARSSARCGPLTSLPTWCFRVRAPPARRGASFPRAHASRECGCRPFLASRSQGANHCWGAVCRGSSGPARHPVSNLQRSREALLQPLAVSKAHIPCPPRRGENVVLLGELDADREPPQGLHLV